MQWSDRSGIRSGGSSSWERLPIRRIVNENGMVSVWIDPYFDRTYEVIAHISFDCPAKHGVGIEAIRGYSEDIACKGVPSFFFNRHDRLIQTDRPLARSNCVKLIVGEEPVSKRQGVGHRSGTLAHPLYICKLIIVLIRVTLRFLCLLLLATLRAIVVGLTLAGPAHGRRAYAFHPGARARMSTDFISLAFCLPRPIKRDNVSALPQFGRNASEHFLFFGREGDIP
jgi:hypothetical protein